MEKNIEYPNIANFNPSSCISGKMMKCNRIIANTFRKHLSPFQITDSQLSILFILSKVDKLNQKRIADFLVLEKSTVNRNLKRLIESNLIKYNEGTILHLTKEGKVLLEKVIPHWQDAMTEIRIILSSDGEDSLNKLLKKLSQRN